MSNGSTRPRVFLQPIAAPSILGLFGFAGATFVVAANVAGWYGTTESGKFLFPFALAFGGIAQVMKLARENGPTGWTAGRPEDRYYANRVQPPRSLRMKRWGVVAAGVGVLAGAGVAARLPSARAEGTVRGRTLRFSR